MRLGGVPVCAISVVKESLGGSPKEDFPANRRGGTFACKSDPRLQTVSTALQRQHSYQLQHRKRYGKLPVSASQRCDDDDDRESDVQHEAEFGHRSHHDLVFHVVVNVPAGMRGQPDRYQQRPDHVINKEGQRG